MPVRPENRDRYPDDWPEISLRIRIERAGGRCECLGECGRGTHDGRCPNANGGTAYGTGSRVVLTVAHLNHTPEDCRDENLRAMCQGCHLRYDRDHHRETAAATRRRALEAAGVLPLFDLGGPAEWDALIEESARAVLALRTAEDLDKRTTTERSIRWTP